MEIYKSWEFCKSVDCRILKDGDNGKLHCPSCPAYKMYQYLRDHGQILEEGSELATALDMLEKIKSDPDNRGLVSLLDETLKQKVKLIDELAGVRKLNADLAKQVLDLQCQAEAYREGLEQIKNTIEENYPNGTLNQPRFGFAKELHDITGKALAALEGETA